MVVVAVPDGDRIQLLAIRQRKEGQRGAAIAFGVHSRIHQQPAIIHFDQPRAGTDIGIRVQICYLHFESITKVGENGPKTETFSLKSPLFLQEHRESPQAYHALTRITCKNSLKKDLNNPKSNASYITASGKKAGWVFGFPIQL